MLKIPQAQDFFSSQAFSSAPWIVQLCATISVVEASRKFYYWRKLNDNFKAFFAVKQSFAFVASFSDS